MKKTLDIIFTSDTHGNIFPVNYAAGTPMECGLLNMAAQVKKDGNTLILDGGDSLQGTPLTQYYLEHRDQYPYHPVAEGFCALGCDYYTLGNHDFNFGYEVLKEYLQAMSGTCLAANVTDLRGELPLQKEAVHIMESGLRVGLCGIVTDYVNVWEQPKNLDGLVVTDPFLAAEESLKRFKDTCDVSICIYHGGFEEDLNTGSLLSDSKENIACKIARELDFDVLLTGHQHMEVEGISLYGTYAVQCPANAQRFVTLHGELDTGKMHRGKLGITSSLVNVGDICEAEPYGKLLPLEQDTQKWLDQPVGLLCADIEPEEKLLAALYGSQVAALFNQVQLVETGADFSCTSLGNMAVGLSSRVTMREICSAYLFANTLVMLEVDREVIRQALEHCASYFTLRNGEPEISDDFLKPKIEHYNYDFYGGLDYVFDLRKPVGKRVVRLTTLDGKPLEDRTYTLVTSNYRATGTGGYDAIGKCPVIWRGAREMPELVADYIRSHSPLPQFENSRFRVIW